MAKGAEKLGFLLSPKGVRRAHPAFDAVMDAAYAWLCQRRRDWPADADIWSFRHRWPEEKACPPDQAECGHSRRRSRHEDRER